MRATPVPQSAARIFQARSNAMMKNRKSFLAHTMARALGAGALGVALLCGGVQVARAQDASESVIVHPESRDYGRIESHRLVGRFDGEVDPTVLTISEPVTYSDLDLSRDSDVNELRLRVRDTAINICSQLAARDINIGDDEVANRECVSRAIETAMAELPNGVPYGVPEE
jgi:UrcA family protein